MVRHLLTVLPVTVLIVSIVVSASFAAPPPVSPASAEALSATLPADARLEALPGNYVLVIPEPFAPPSQATDPFYKYSTSRILYVYEKNPGTPALTRRVALHFAEDDRASALHSARLIARFLRLHRERFGRETTFRRAASEAHIWFVPTPATAAHVGGETRDANVYVFAASRIGSPVELVRTVAHEWGHQTLPAARGYAEPENDAAGYLGERLYLRWLLEDGVNCYPDDSDSLTSSLTSYRDRQITPLMERWQQGGPANAALSGDRTESMDYYIGAVLDCDRSFGSRVTGEALYTIADTGAQDFVDALTESLAVQLESGLKVSLPAWIALKPGTYQATNGDGVLVLQGTSRISVPLDRNKIPSVTKSAPATQKKKRGVRVHPFGSTAIDGMFRVGSSDWYRVDVSDSITPPTVSLKKIPDKKRIAAE